jgi:AAA+ superfamily predicted ATPase
MFQESILRNALSLPPSAIAYYISETLASRFPDKALIEGQNPWFDVEQYAQAGLCSLTTKETLYNQAETNWRGHELTTQRQLAGARIPLTSINANDIVDRFKNAWLEIQWRGLTLDIILARWSEGFSPISHYWILAPHVAQAKEFLQEVCAWNSEVRGEVLVFSGSCWQKDASLFQSIKTANFDNLILRGNLKQEIFEDLQQFFAAREMYETYNIPWKRGILFVGPPGNGKTHTVKAIINALEQPCLYIKSFRSEHGTEEDNIHAVFERARKSAPCILVMEDLDSLLNAQNRSFFLNELDGFAANAGVITIATTNHPERLDPAILDRPSRFDRKYPFDLPALPERIDYITMWNASLQPALRLSDEGITRLASVTEGFSFAYLKELFLSSMVRWISKQQQHDMENVMIEQENVLREQMVSAISQDAKLPDENAQNIAPATLRRMLLRGGPA